VLSVAVVQAIINGVLIGGFYSLIGMGLSVIFGVMKIINFCQGELLMIGMYLSFVFYVGFGLDPYLSIPLVAACLFALGSLVQHSLITPSLGTKSFTNVLFLTVGLGILFVNLMQIIFGSDFRSIQTAFSGMTLGGSTPFTISVPRLISLGVVILVATALFYFLKYTTTGKRIRATSQNPVGAQIVGINVKLTYMITYGLGAALAGVAGALLIPFFFVFPTVGATFGTRAFIVVVIGGLGNIKGAFAAGIFLGVMETVSALLAGPTYRDIVVFLVFILILIARQKLKLREA